MRRLVAMTAGALFVLSLAPAATTAQEGDITIIRDEYGVPHVFADDLDGLFHGFGYIQAQDRLWQGELLRRTATGTMAEVLGAGSVASDTQMRLLFGPAERRAQLFDDASSDMQTMLSAHADGMNAWISEATASGALPIEYGVFGLSPRPWTVDDTIAVFMMVGSQFGWFGSDELSTAATYAGLISALGPEDAAAVFADTHWLDDPSAPTTAPGGGTAATSAASPTRAPEPPRRLDSAVERAAAEVEATNRAVERARERAGLRGDSHASNAAVIAPELSRDGSTLLLGGPQMGYSAPQINHEVGLHGAGFDITGMTIVGFPLIPIGVGDGFAWTLTSGGTDNTDIFQETLDPSDPSRYLHDGEWVDLDCRVEEIPVAGSAPSPQTLCRTVHGPVIAGDGGTAFTMKISTEGKELDSLEAWSSLGAASDIEEFAAALPGVAYNFNVLYADDDGNIAYWHIGHIPVRADSVDPRFPTPGTGEAEWQGVVPFGQMPNALNPEQGWMASWNNKPAAGWGNSSADFWRWGPVHRVNTFMNELAGIEPGTASARTLMRLNRTGGWTTDTPSGAADLVTVSTYGDDLMRLIDRTVDPRLAEVQHVLKRWNHLQVDRDGDGHYDGPGGAIYNAWWQAIRDRVFADDTAGLIDDFTVANLIERLISDDPALPVTHDYLDGESLSTAVSEALASALDELEARYGSPDMDDWDQPIATISWDPLGVGTVPDTIWMNRGTYNQVVHLGNDGNDLWAENVVAPGQSGDPRSPHFDDQLELYATWRYKPMRLTERDLRHHTESVTVLSSSG